MNGYPLLTEEHLQIPVRLARRYARTRRNQRTLRYEEMVSEGYVALLLAYRAYDPDAPGAASLTTYLFASVARRLAGFGRSGHGNAHDRRWRQLAALPAAGPPAASRDLDLVEARDELERVAAALNLSGRQRELMRLRWLEGRTAQDVGERLGISHQAVDKALAKVREKAVRWEAERRRLVESAPAGAI